jgi:hypothetical protein
MQDYLEEKGGPIIKTDTSINFKNYNGEIDENKNTLKWNINQKNIKEKVAHLTLYLPQI